MIILAPIFVIVLVWLLAVVVTNDFSVKTTTIEKFQNILAIFPHPDDEVFSCGGILHSAVKMHKNVTVVILTKGEKGTPDATLNQSLKATRTEELTRVMNILGIGNCMLEDFGDGELSQKKDLLYGYVKNVLHTIQPDLVITYDQSGLYGHPDHIAVSEVVTECINQTNLPITLWYASITQSERSRISLPTHMAQDPHFLQKQKLPSQKVFVLDSIIKKIQSIYAYKSQMHGFKKSFPAYLPLWFAFSTRIFEYFYELPIIHTTSRDSNE